MPGEIGIKMKVLRSSGRLADLISEDGHSTDPEFQHLIVMPKNPMKSKCAIMLRYIFFTLVIMSAISVFYIIARDHYFNKSPTSQNQIQLSKSPSNESGKHPLIEGACSIDEKWKFDCHPEDGASETECIKRGCCWSPIEPRTGVPWCYYTQEFSYYTWTNFTVTSFGLQGNAQVVRQSPYPSNVGLLSINVYFETEDTIRIKIFDSTKQRYEVPLPYKSYETKSALQNYTFQVARNGFRVIRKGELFPLFDSTVAPMIFADQFIQISSPLVSEYVYGIGESEDTLKRNINWSRYVLYNHDVVPSENKNLYGSHPFYMAMDKLGHTYGVFLANSNAMEVVLQPGPAITFRTIGGILDLRIFIGPKPSDVTNQYTNIIGRPSLPPYWSLGFHLCRFNYGTVAHTEEILENNIKAGIPIDVQWNDLDYMSHQNDFTYDPVKFSGLPEFVNKLHARGMRYVPLIDPGISGGEDPGNYTPYDEGIKKDIFIKDANGNPFVGKVWNPKSTVWPDFSHPNVTTYWLNQIDYFRKTVPFDGAWIDMNEPSNFWDGTSKGCMKDSTLDHPPYTPHVDGGKLYYKTICPSALQYGGSHYDLHNLYGTQESMVTFNVLGDLTNERPFIISRSTFPGQGKYGGHWTGDVVSTWNDMRKSIPQILTFGLFGIPMVGADICGFNGNTTVELCKRWMQLGAFYPFSRNHNTDDGIPQDPASLGKEVIEASKVTLTLRYNLLPYIYSLFFRAHLTGEPVARPLFFEFYDDIQSFDVEKSFMLGPAIMIVPVLEEGYNNSTISAYLPKGWWYHNDHPVIIESYGEMKDLVIPPNSLPVLYKGGSIIMKQTPGQTTTESRKNNFSIHVYLSKFYNATGEFFWDDGVSNLPDVLTNYKYFTFHAKDNVFSMQKVHGEYETNNNMTLGQIEVRGIPIGSTIQSAVLNNIPWNFTFTSQALVLDNLNLTGTEWTDGLTLKWT